VKRSAASELEFDKVQELVAARARTSLGRRRITRSSSLPDPDARRRLARLTSAVQRLLDEDGPLSFAGLDDALPWLEPSAPAPT
jgi:dsDNA-specific endonuclease/ATPase MutS2